MLNVVDSKRRAKNHSQHPLVKRLDYIIAKVEEENKYDFDRIMTEIDLRFIKREKRKKLIEKSREKERSFQKKLNEMNEYRQNLEDEKRNKILEKQKD